MPRSFPDQFCTSIPTALAAIPVCDDIFFETRRLASEWLSSKLINDEAAKRILDCCTVPSYGQRLDWTSRNHDIVRVSRGIIDLTAAQAKVAAVTRKRKAALMSQGSPAAEDVSAAETDEVLKNAVDANKRLRRSVEDIKTSLQGTEECIQKFRIHVNQRRQRLLELLSDRGGDADTGAAADAAAADSTAAAAAASGGVDAAAGDEDASPVPAEQTEGGARSPVPTRGADDAADPSVPSGRVSPVPGTPPPEVLFTKGQKVVRSCATHARSHTLSPLTPPTDSRRCTRAKMAMFAVSSPSWILRLSRIRCVLRTFPSAPLPLFFVSHPSAIHRSCSTAAWSATQKATGLSRWPTRWTRSWMSCSRTNARRRLRPPPTVRRSRCGTSANTSPASWSRCWRPSLRAPRAAFKRRAANVSVSLLAPRLSNNRADATKKRKEKKKNIY